MNRYTTHRSGVSSRFSFAVLAALTVALVGCSANLLDTTEELPRGATSPFDGYTFFGPIRSTIIYLVDMAGELAHKWETDYNGGSLYMLESGNLLRSTREPNPVGFRAGGERGIVQKIAWDGTVVCEFKYSTKEYRHHHDMEPLPNGNVLLIACERATLATPESLEHLKALGYIGGGLDQDNRPNISRDWLHTNSIDYNSEKD